MVDRTTLDDKTARAACARLWELWQDGGVTASLEPAIRPSTRADGYAIQAHFESFSAQPRRGWKIAATSAAGQTHIGVDGPLAGRLLAERIHEEGAELSIASSAMKVAEPEFAFRLARDLSPRDGGYDLDAVRAAVGDLHPALELPDSRFVDFVSVGGPSLIADNACADRLVLGEAVSTPWRHLDLAAHKVRAEVEGRYGRDGSGAAVLGDPWRALLWLVNEVTGLGITIAAGEIVTTGTCMVPLDLEPGDRVHADYGRLGSIAVRIAER